LFSLCSFQNTVYNTQMSDVTHKFLEHIFFFAILGTSAYFVWQLFLPFVGALSLAAIIVVICNPLYEGILKRLPNNNKSIAALGALAFVVVAIVVPLGILTSLILSEAISIYTLFNATDHASLFDSLTQFESIIQTFIPTFTLDVATVVQQTASFFVEHLVSLFAGTASTIFLFFLSLIASYYFFKDGKHFTTYLIQLSPLKDADDARILARLATAVRSVALGTVSVAIIQGTLTALGLTLFGFDRAILWGCVAAIGALVPGIGTAIVFIPAVGFLLYSGAYLSALLLGIWGAIAVGLIDNLIGPYVMSRGNNVHPFLILLSVLGGIPLFGPLGFILGPVILSLFMVLLELYHHHIKKGE